MVDLTSSSVKTDRSERQIRLLSQLLFCLLDHYHIRAYTLPQCILLWICKNLYYVFFGPLAQYPGPRFWAFTDLAYWYYALRGELNAKIKHLHDRYGAIVRIAPTRLSYTASDAWKDIYVYGHNNEHQIFHKDPVFYAVFRESRVPRGINNAEGPYHARLRRQLSYAFSDKALKEQEPLITEHLDMLIRRLQQFASTGSKADMTQWFNFVTFDGKQLAPSIGECLVLDRLQGSLD